MPPSTYKNSFFQFTLRYTKFDCCLSSIVYSETAVLSPPYLPRTKSWRRYHWSQVKVKGYNAVGGTSSDDSSSLELPSGYQPTIQLRSSSAPLYSKPAVPSYFESRYFSIAISRSTNCRMPLKLTFDLLPPSPPSNSA